MPSVSCDRHVLLCGEAVGCYECYFEGRLQKHGAVFGLTTRWQKQTGISEPNCSSESGTLQVASFVWDSQKRNLASADIYTEGMLCSITPPDFSPNPNKTSRHRKWRKMFVQSVLVLSHVFTEESSSETTRQTSLQVWPNSDKSWNVTPPRPSLTSPSHGWCVPGHSGSLCTASSVLSLGLERSSIFSMTLTAQIESFLFMRQC